MAAALAQPRGLLWQRLHAGQPPWRSLSSSMQQLSWCFDSEACGRPYEQPPEPEWEVMLDAPRGRVTCCSLTAAQELPAGGEREPPLWGQGLSVAPPGGGEGGGGDSPGGKASAAAFDWPCLTKILLFKSRG